MKVPVVPQTKPSWTKLLPVDKTPSHLPPRFSFCPIIGNRKTGKTTLLTNIVKDVKDVYSSIFVFSPTCKKDWSWEYLDKSIPHLFLVDEPTPEMVEFVYNDQIKKYKKYIQQLKSKGEKRKKSGFDFNEEVEEERKEKPPFALFIFDDLSSEYQYYQKILKKLAYTSRHDGTGVFITSHNVRSLPPGCRSNANALILFKIAEFERDKFVYEHSDKMSVKNLALLLDAATEQDFSFLFYNESKPKESRFSIGFES
jgi:hypothetical protein